MMLRPADAQPCATLRLPVAHPRPPAQCGAAQQPSEKGKTQRRKVLGGSPEGA